MIDKYKVKEILKEVKEKTFTKGYEATDEEAMGILLSQYFKWNGLSVLEATYNALEDANFHKENETVLEMINRLKER